MSTQRAASWSHVLPSCQLARLPFWVSKARTILPGGLNWCSPEPTLQSHFPDTPSRQSLADAIRVHTQATEADWTLEELAVVGMQVSPERAHQLVQNSAVVLLLDIPAGTRVGLDQMV